VFETTQDNEKIKKKVIDLPYVYSKDRFEADMDERKSNWCE